MTRLIRFEAWHARALKDHGGQEALLASTSDAELVGLESAGDAFTILDDERIIACGGIIRCNRFRGVAWGLLQKDCPRTFFAVHRHVIQVLDAQPYAIVATYVKPTFMQGMRWAPMLGFKLERPYIPYWFPDGSGASEWVRFPPSRAGGDDAVEPG